MKNENVPEEWRQAIECEPELPDAMPDEMWAAIKDDRDAATEAMRLAVRFTKAGILARLSALLAAPAPEQREKVELTADQKAIDAKVEAALCASGFRWNGDRWECEDADLLPAVRAAAADMDTVFNLLDALKLVTDTYGADTPMWDQARAAIAAHEAKQSGGV